MVDRAREVAVGSYEREGRARDVRAADASRSASEPPSTPSVRASGYWSAIDCASGPSSRSSRASDAASWITGSPWRPATRDASRRRRACRLPRMAAGAHTSAVGRALTSNLRSARPNSAVVAAVSAPTPASSHASRAAYSMASVEGTSARTRGSRRGGFRSSIEVRLWSR